MTQGSKMSIVNPTTPAAIVAPAETSTIRATWAAVHRTAGANDYATYALARQLHAATRLGYEVSAGELLERSLRKLVRTFGPIRNQNKLSNGRKQFGTLQAVLLSLKSYGPGQALGAVLDEDEQKQLVRLADALFTEVRRRGNEELLKLAPPHVFREKKPYVPK